MRPNDDEDDEDDVDDKNDHNDSNQGEEDYGEEDDDEEYREVDPMQVVEDRLMLLEAWLHEDPGHEDVIQKREEYMSLLEELEILGKKMRKTDKLLAVPNQPNATKLERKRDQYEREVTDIVLYAEQDTFFNLEEESGEAAMSAYMKANSLLGKPLETLAEMSGFEDSEAWNDSFGTLAGDRSVSVSTHTRMGKNSSLGASAVSQLDMSIPHNVTVIKKKLKKAKQLLEDATSETERKKLLNKINEYREALERAEDHVNKDNDTDEDGESHASEESIETPTRSPGKALMSPRPIIPPKAKQKKPPKLKEGEDGGGPEYILLKKKLNKAKKLVQATSNPKEVTKLKKKVNEYLSLLITYPAWESDQLAYGYGTGHAVEEGQNEKEWTGLEANAEDERSVEEEEEIQQPQATVSSLGSNVRRKSSEDTNMRDEKKSPALQDDSLDLQMYIDEELKQNRLYRKKLKKVDTILKTMVDQEGEDTRLTKEYRKLLKKRRQYLMELGEDHASLASLSQISGGSSTAIMSIDESSSIGFSISENTVEISMANISLDDGTEEDAVDRQSGMAKDAKRDQERQRQRDDRLAAARATADASNNATNDENPDIQLVRKKLKKLEKMLKVEKKGSKNEEKLLKKKRQYLAELGEYG